MSEKLIDKEALKSSLANLWKLQGTINFKDVGLNLFVLVFIKEYDILKVQEGRPWTFDRNLLCLAKYDSRLMPKQVDFSMKHMWVQIHNLSLGMMNSIFDKQFEKSIDEVLDLDVDKEGMGWGPYLCVKVNVNIRKPFQRLPCPFWHKPI